MFRLSGFLFGAAVAILILAVILVAPVREIADALVTEISNTLFNPVDELEINQREDISSADIVPATTHDNQKLPEQASIKKVEAVMPSASQDLTSSSQESTTATQLNTGAPPVTQKTQVLSVQSTPIADKTVNTAPDALKQEVSADSRSTADGNQADEAMITWQPVWRAFRNELSAAGFADYLQRLTNQEYRVRRISPWSYQVELAYIDESQRDTLLHEIQNKTGLNLVEALP